MKIEATSIMSTREDGSIDINPILHKPIQIMMSTHHKEGKLDNVWAVHPAGEQPVLTGSYIPIAFRLVFTNVRVYNLFTFVPPDSVRKEALWISDDFRIVRHKTDTPGVSDLTNTEILELLQSLDQ